VELVLYAFSRTEGNFGFRKPQNILRVSPTENTKLTDSASGLVGVLYQSSQDDSSTTEASIVFPPPLSAVELLASFIVDSGGGVLSASAGHPTTVMR
jgi:hypothetical protein